MPSNRLRYLVKSESHLILTRISDFEASHMQFDVILLLSYFIALLVAHGFALGFFKILFLPLVLYE